jgi:DNA-binding NtrC family response regulator
MEAIESAPPDVVLLDYWLPGSRDLSLLTKIRRRSPATVVIMMTAYGGHAMETAALELGAWRVLSKPLDMHDVGHLVRAALESAC